ncbi:hypothetical protein BC628DRAFT_1395043 [Trametes gibbosa]|nr:hypothetical protein BC628DRAFT_1395043 [Trametes gibbosa]
MFTVLVARFPADRRPSFYGGYEQLIRFPFRKFAFCHHKSKPDLAVSWPGNVLPLHEKIKHPHWRQFSMAIEVKDLSSRDPFKMIGKNRKWVSADCIDKLVQLAANARNLIFAHGLLAAFTLGVYGEVVRIVRFNHACAVTSPPVNIKTKEGLRAIQEFFWQFVHPWEGGPGAVVGADPTVRHLTTDDREWLKECLGSEEETLLRGIDLAEAHWVKVWDAASKLAVFVLFELLDVNARLFSWSTMVWSGVEDTWFHLRGGSEPPRAAEDAHDESKGQPDVVLRIIKDAWRQCYACTAEIEFYNRMNKVLLNAEDLIGLPQLVHGGDMGVRDIKRWLAASRGETWEGEDDLLGMADSAGSEASECSDGLLSRFLPAPTSPL